MQLRLMRWIGGKIRMVHILNKLFPEDCVEYYEPFIGSGAVLMNKHRHAIEVINDKDEDLANLHRILADPIKGKLLIDILFQQEVNETMYYGALKKLQEQSEEIDDVERARCKFLTQYLSFNADGKTYRGVPQSEYNKDIRYQLPKIFDRYRNVEVRTGCGIELVRQIKDKENAFVFADPPYDLSLRGAKQLYKCEMPEDLQVEMLETMKDAKCKIMLCGYADEQGEDLYDRTLIPTGRWKRYELARISKSIQNTKKVRDVAVEYIWVNYELPSFAKYVINMGKEFSASCKTV